MLKNDYKIVLVHGGGFFVNEVMERMNIKPIFVKSPSGVVSRYTDWNTLQCYVMAMMWINKEIVSKLQKINVNAIGITGCDAKLLLAKRKDKIIIVDERGRQRVINGGFTGKIISVNINILDELVSNYVPVIAPIAYSEDGYLLNVDSDQVTYSIAINWKPNYVIILLDVEGLLIQGKVVNKLSPDEALKLFNKSSEITGGMKRKLYMAAQIAKEGIPVIISSGLIENPIINALSGKGTHVVR